MFQLIICRAGWTEVSFNFFRWTSFGQFVADFLLVDLSSRWLISRCALLVVDLIVKWVDAADDVKLAAKKNRVWSDEDDQMFGGPRNVQDGDDLEEPNNEAQVEETTEQCHLGTISLQVQKLASQYRMSLFKLTSLTPIMNRFALKATSTNKTTESAAYPAW